MASCIFCKIAEGEVKSWTVYEDELVKAFFDINPASEGHTLIIPKKHYDNIYEIPENVLERIIIVVKKLAIVYKKALDVKAVNILHASGKDAQQDVFHFHIHLVPRYENDKLNLWYQTQSEVKANFGKILEKTKRFID